MIFRIANPVVFRFHVFCFPECIPQSQLFCGSSSTYAGDGPSKHCNRLLGVLSTASVQKLPCAFHRTNRNDKLPGNCKDNHSPPRARFNSMFEGCQCANQFLFPVQQAQAAVVWELRPLVHLYVNYVSTWFCKSKTLLWDFVGTVPANKATLCINRIACHMLVMCYLFFISRVEAIYTRVEAIATSTRLARR